MLAKPERLDAFSLLFSALVLIFYHPSLPYSFLQPNSALHKRHLQNSQPRWGDWATPAHTAVAPSKSDEPDPI